MHVRYDNGIPTFYKCVIFETLQASLTGQDIKLTFHMDMGNCAISIHGMVLSAGTSFTVHPYSNL
jgi:hypothetical protein